MAAPKCDQYNTEPLLHARLTASSATSWSSNSAALSFIAFVMVVRPGTSESFGFAPRGRGFELYAIKARKVGRSVTLSDWR
jgi:hypothetical protein